MHASELADPTPYLDGGELLLSVGMWLDPAAESAARPRRPCPTWTAWSRSGWSAWGSGSGCSTPRCRPRWSTRPRPAGLPLLRVPEQTAFVAVGRSVWEALAADQHAEVTRTSSPSRT